MDIGWTDTEGEDATQRGSSTAPTTAGGKRACADAADGPGWDRWDEIAEFVVFLLSDRSGVVTGSVLDWDQIVFGAHD